MQFSDKTLVCSNCGSQFTFTASEQQFYSSKGFTNEPRRCPTCRASRKQDRESGGEMRSSSGPRQMYSIVCANCGKEAQVPFEPRQGRPVYCNDCYSRERASSGGSRSYGR
ncbi:MAG: zinc-ribbon domain containing protein [Chloroflexi bacterium]|nr:zinc-ribbon domain containing protein [Chloroflexota bacterium]MBI4197909.1 zinc-ribbon domain containing protein [Chloroflexota bacterium]